jgi:hypothetical protein
VPAMTVVLLIILTRTAPIARSAVMTLAWLSVISRPGMARTLRSIARLPVIRPVLARSDRQPRMLPSLLNPSRSGNPNGVTCDGLRDHITHLLSLHRRKPRQREQQPRMHFLNE